ncbi:MAG: A/G-specific adenine glycosylase [Pelotomaculum sp. PtaB.Bin013]|nr:MAG: A/G-specific adenine glycosylase [Pelotomaculum sp. PtaB.Bin013]
MGLVKRAKLIKEFARVLVAEYGGKPPTDKKAILNLPGVGPYTASAVLCFAYGKREAILDTNVERILSRFFGISHGLTGTRRYSVLWEASRKLLPKKNFREFNWALLDFAALVCTFSKPKCLRCPMKNLCAFIEINKSQIS